MINPPIATPLHPYKQKLNSPSKAFIDSASINAFFLLQGGAPINTPKRNVHVHFMVFEDERSMIKQKITEVGTLNLSRQKPTRFFIVWPIFSVLSIDFFDRFPYNFINEITLIFEND